MENESLGMAMAKLAKPIPPKKSFSPSGYGESGENGEKAKSPRQGKPGFRQNSQNSRSHSVEINFSAEPHVTLSELPERLVTAVIRVCREIHDDDDAAMQTMMEDLCWDDPADWPALTQHFESQLPPSTKALPALVTCSGCTHAEYRHHPVIAHCKAGIDSGNPSSGRWATEPHPCEKWKGKTAKTPDKNAHQGAN
jgi:hypothetical protein